MSDDTFRDRAATIVAGFVIVVLPLVAFAAWLQPIDPDQPRDLAILYGALFGVVGVAAGYLFSTQAANRAVATTMRALGVSRSPLD